MPHKLAFVFGTRPEAIKLAPVIDAAARDSAFVVKTCATAQHREMLDQMLAGFGILPDYDLGLMREDQKLLGLTSETLVAVGKVLAEVRPDLVVVQGDTTTAMVAALAAFYDKIPVAHVEAGLRTHDAYAPFPEEVNRRIVSVIAALNFAPTEGASANLIREGVPESRIAVVGNTVIDAVRAVTTRDAAEPAPADGRLLLVTVHRRETTGALDSICRAIRQLVDEFPDVRVVWPVHPNPNVEPVVRASLDGCPRVRIVPPLDYRGFLQLLKTSYCVLTDSGGIQEEAPVFGKPVLVLREVSERPEGIALGTARLTGTATDAILEQARILLTDAAAYQSMARVQSPYGDGQAAGRILEIVRRFLARGRT